MGEVLHCRTCGKDYRNLRAGLYSFAGGETMRSYLLAKLSPSKFTIRDPRIYGCAPEVASLRRDADRYFRPYEYSRGLDIIGE